jgi:hypothetical protein
MKSISRSFIPPADDLSALFCVCEAIINGFRHRNVEAPMGPFRRRQSGSLVNEPRMQPIQSLLQIGDSEKQQRIERRIMLTIAESLNLPSTAQTNRRVATARCGAILHHLRPVVMSTC